MGILDSIKKMFGGGGSAEPAAPEASAPEAPAVPEMAAPEIGGGTDVGSNDQTQAV